MNKSVSSWERCQTRLGWRDRASDCVDVDEVNINKDLAIPKYGRVGSHFPVELSKFIVTLEAITALAPS